MLNHLRAHPNVVRFPVEQRVEPSLELLGDIAPNADLVGLLIEGTDLETSITEARDDADRDAAERIMNEVDPAPGPRRRQALTAMLDAILVPAIEACRRANNAWAKHEAAERRYDVALREGECWLAPLADKMSAQTGRATELVVEAYILSQKALGTARAIRLAMRNEPWSPFDLGAEAAALFGIHDAAAAG